MKCATGLVCFAFLLGRISAALQPRIIGGSNANIKDFKYLASIRAHGRTFCGGAIISERHILTAAHCFTTDLMVTGAVNPYDVKIHTGTSYSYKETGYVHPIADITIHPKWLPSMKLSYANDIAVITLGDKIKFDSKQQKIELPFVNIVSEMEAYFCGWGYTAPSRKPSMSPQLQKLKMKILAYEDCQLHVPIKIQPSQLCGFHSMGRGACLGDSGGPLVVGMYVVGILSWVHEGKCAAGIPEVYSNVYVHRKFIESAMRK